MENDVRTRKDGDALGSVGDVGWYCIRYTFEGRTCVFGTEISLLCIAISGAFMACMQGSRKFRQVLGSNELQSYFIIRNCYNTMRNWAARVFVGHRAPCQV